MISIHALREEGDPILRSAWAVFPYFYPRPPRGGRHPRICRGSHCTGISIHALREEGDLVAQRLISTLMHFYPRPPRGGRPTSKPRAAAIFLFLSTPSARRATPRSRPAAIYNGNFYPRPPRGGRPRRMPLSGRPYRYFYPRPPRGGRPLTQRLGELASQFLSTPSARRATSAGKPAVYGSGFLSTPSARRATRHCPRPRLVEVISIHALREEGDSRRAVGRKDRGISIHALREEGDLYTRSPSNVATIFLSTPSARRATYLTARLLSPC